MDREEKHNDLYKQFARRIIFNIAIFKSREMEINSIGIASAVFMLASICHTHIHDEATKLCAIATFVSVFCSVITILMVTFSFRTSTDLLIRTKREYMEGGPHVVPTGWVDVVQWFLLVVNAAAVLVQYEQLLYG